MLAAGTVERTRDELVIPGLVRHEFTRCAGGGRLQLARGLGDPVHHVSDQVRIARTFHARGLHFTPVDDDRNRGVLADFAMAIDDEGVEAGGFSRGVQPLRLLQPDEHIAPRVRRLRGRGNALAAIVAHRRFHLHGAVVDIRLRQFDPGVEPAVFVELRVGIGERAGAGGFAVAVAAEHEAFRARILRGKRTRVQARIDPHVGVGKRSAGIQRGARVDPHRITGNEIRAIEFRAHLERRRREIADEYGQGLPRKAGRGVRRRVCRT